MRSHKYSWPLTLFAKQSLCTHAGGQLHISFHYCVDAPKKKKKKSHAQKPKLTRQASFTLLLYIVSLKLHSALLEVRRV